MMQIKIGLKNRLHMPVWFVLIFGSVLEKKKIGNWKIFPKVAEHLVDSLSSNPE